MGNHITPPVRSAVARGDISYGKVGTVPSSWDWSPKAPGHASRIFTAEATQVRGGAEPQREGCCSDQTPVQRLAVRAKLPPRHAIQRLLSTIGLHHSP